MEWRNVEIEGFEGMYQVSDTGLARSLDRIVIQKNGLARKSAGKVLVQDLKPNGYRSVNLANKAIGIKKHYAVHRLVACAFISNPDEKPQVNHKDGNKQNNHVSNLEWCTAKENTGHAFSNSLRSTGHLIPYYEKTSKPILQILDGNVVNQFKSLSDAVKKNGLPIYAKTDISRACYKPSKIAYGYNWRYA